MYSERPGPRPGLSRVWIDRTSEECLPIAVIQVCRIKFFLRATGNEAGTPPVGVWIGVCGLGFIGALVVLHVVVWRRWPLRDGVYDTEGIGA
jgi:hypothetical protein